MKIIIPMSGVGKRFVDVGYSDVKPLIKVNGKPIIEHVINMFPGNHDFIFICNRDHLVTTNMEQILRILVPEAIIIPIDSHDKGSVHATSFAHPYISDTDEVLVSYCDYAMDFDFERMNKEVHLKGYDGAVPAYTGFHPHLLHKKLYGGILVDKNGDMFDYKEKHSFTEDPMQSHHSAGAYYFKNGKEFKNYSDELIRSNERINGEAYTSMMYYLYLRDGKKILVPEIKKFMQWGTPEDLEEFEAWIRYIAKESGIQKKETSIPSSREDLISIPYKESSDMFTQVYSYWEEYLKKQQEF
jgi:NDP-sugar pyrophosphorylase family protein